MSDKGMMRKCVFEITEECPVKKMYKLRPESLVEFCKVCKQLKVSFPSEALNIMLALTEKEYKLGKAQAEAALYKKMYEDAKKD